MEEIQFRTGVFRHFKARVKFHLGRLQIDVPEGAEVQFDGTTMVLGGVHHAYPELRSPIKTAWLVPIGDNISSYLPQSANVSVRAALGGKGKMASTEVQKDETFAGTVKPVAPPPPSSDGVMLSSKAFNPTLVKDTEGDGRTVGPARKAASAADTTGASSEGSPVARMKTPPKQTVRVDGITPTNVDDTKTIQDVMEPVAASPAKVAAKKIATTQTAAGSSEGEVVSSVKVATSAKQKITVADASAASQATSKLDNMQRSVVVPKGKQGKSIAAVSGDTLEDIIPAADKDSHGAILAAEERRNARLKQVGAATMKTVNPLLAAMAEVEEDEVPPAPAPKEAPKAPKVAAKPPKSVEDFAINGTSVELAPGFRWDKSVHWKTRVKMALTYANDPARLDLIRGYEVPSVVKLIDAGLLALAAGAPNAE